MKIGTLLVVVLLFGILLAYRGWSRSELANERKSALKSYLSSHSEAERQILDVFDGKSPVRWRAPHIAQEQYEEGPGMSFQRMGMITSPEGKVFKVEVGCTMLDQHPVREDYIKVIYSLSSSDLATGDLSHSTLASLGASAKFAKVMAVSHNHLVDGIWTIDLYPEKFDATVQWHRF